MLFKVVIAAVGGLFALTYMVLSSVGPGVYLSVISPFDALFSGLFGIWGNAATFLPLLAMLLVISPSYWIPQFFGTRIQQAFFLFILALSISHIVAFFIYPDAAIIEYLRKLTVFMLVGIWAWYMGSAEQLLSVNRALVVATAAFTVISMADFYFGLGALPGAQTHLVGGVVGELIEETSSIHDLRYRGGGLPINRTANWLLIPSFIGFGWFMLSSRGLGKTFALLCTIVCVTGIFATVSRSAIGATIVGFLVLLPTAIGVRPARILGALVTVAAIGAVGLFLMDQIGFLEVIEERFSGDVSDGDVNKRFAVYSAAVRIWWTSPVIGVGDASMPAHPLYIGNTAHNSFLGLLAEAGLVGFLPYVFLTFLFIKRFVGLSPYADPAFVAWRPYFLAGYIASMTQNMFNEYTWERFIWYSVAYLVALERLEAVGRAEASRRLIEQMQGTDPTENAAPASGLGAPLI